MANQIYCKVGKTVHFSAKQEVRRLVFSSTLLLDVSATGFVGDGTVIALSIQCNRQGEMAESSTAQSTHTVIHLQRNVNQ